MLTIDKAKAYTLPDGSYLKIECGGGEGQGWQSVDIALVTPDGKEAVLCAVDHSEKSGLRTFVYSEDDEEPIFVYMNGGRGKEPTNERDKI